MCVSTDCLKNWPFKKPYERWTDRDIKYFKLFLVLKFVIEALAKASTIYVAKMSQHINIKP